jgi:hypothetical protein
MICWVTMLCVSAKSDVFVVAEASAAAVLVLRAASSNSVPCYRRFHMESTGNVDREHVEGRVVLDRTAAVLVAAAVAPARRECGECRACVCALAADAWAAAAAAA